jgi:hypothetical protein
MLIRFFVSFDQFGLYYPLVLYNKAYNDVVYYMELTLLNSTVHRAGILEQSMGARQCRHRVGIGLSYRPARLHRLAEFIPWNRFLGSINI